ncbi:hypothetical protein [Actinoplanes sp. N902-109]|uniref:hypothetical protein n=1 Tax=Actinoplanes sp. (strain N902-109) TaxID=649831 RepID=UPI000329428C|nr:hypothetical protein [Actinoplanes sp. N902-109]AGL19473.1 hypothetical protein L083_5963 [Actinoplanes sp. N902-109]
MHGLIRALLVLSALVATPTFIPARYDQEPASRAATPIPTLTLPTIVPPVPPNGGTSIGNSNPSSPTPRATRTTTPTARHTSLPPKRTPSPVSSPTAAHHAHVVSTRIGQSGAARRDDEDGADSEQRPAGAPAETRPTTALAASPGSLPPAATGPSTSVSVVWVPWPAWRRHSYIARWISAAIVGVLLAAVLIRRGHRLLIRNHGTLIVVTEPASRPEAPTDQPPPHEGKPTRRQPGYAAGYLDGWNDRATDDQDDEDEAGGSHLRLVE